MSKYKKLFNNTLIYALGNMTSKIIMFLLVPLYTFTLTTSQFGQGDIIVTTVNMLYPIISLSIYDALLRFILEDINNEQSVLTNSILVTTISTIIFLGFLPLLNQLGLLKNRTFLTFLYLLTTVYEMILSQYTRSVNRLKDFAIKGILLSISIAIFGVILLSIYKLGVDGYIISLILANIVSILYMTVRTKAYNKVKVKFFDKDLIIKMLKYSIPLIPNTVLWWAINSSSKFFIGFYQGESANGLFAVASKIPALVTMVTTIFMQAWQVSAIEEFKSEDKSNFYSRIFNLLSSLLFISSIFILLIIKDLFRIAIAPEYYSGWMPVVFLLISTIFSSLSSFLGTNYIAAKDTKGVLKTSIYSGVFSIIFNYIFIPKLGIVGAGISSFLSFFLLAFIRLFDTRKFISIEINIKEFIINMISYAFIGLVLFLNINIIPEKILIITTIIFTISSNKTLISFIKVLFNKLINRKTNK